MSQTVRLHHCRLELALHQLADGGAPTLLWLHELGASSPTAVPEAAREWPGAVWALDLSGHGQSQRARAGGYSPEVLMGDVDAALAEIGPATIVGEGIGAFLALLITGSRPDRVRGVVLCDGVGLEGGGARPKPIGGIWLPAETVAPLAVTRDDPAAADPYALVELSRDIRPPGYAKIFARQAYHLGAVDRPISVATTRPHPPWLQALLECPGVVVAETRVALERYAQAG